MPLPTSALEEWRYSRIDSLDPDRYPAATTAPGRPAPLRDLEDVLGALGPLSARVDTCDGFLTGLSGAADGVTLAPFADLGQAPPGVAGTPDRFVAANRPFAPDTGSIWVRPGVTAAAAALVARAV